MYATWLAFTSISITFTHSESNLTARNLLSVLTPRKKSLIHSASVSTDATEQRGICNNPFGFGSLLSS